MDTDEDRIRDEAHKLWEGEGRPDGRAERHWAEAREIVALRDSMGSTLKPVQETMDEPAEPTLAAENLGDLPGMTDQGDEVLAPSRKAAAGVADEEPLVTDADAKKAKAKPKGDKAKAKAEPAKAKPATGKTKEKASPKRKSA